ncbi:MAG: glycosyltransferase [Bacteroidales bacterium]|nr:glycosyltransferase [Bacteroidales bacterium]
MKEIIPLVSICCVVYNHEKFLKQCLEGFLMQQTEFDFEIIVHDDASKDRSQSIIRDYCQQYPALFRAILQTENQFSQGRRILPILLQNARGKYFALCEGDDYWTDPLKLQKQVDYMEKHDDCYMSTHASFWEVDGNLVTRGCQYEDERDLTTDEVIRNGGLYLATASLIFRRELLDSKPQWMKKADIGDYPLQIWGSVRGKLHYFPQQMCVYRYQVPGSWTDNLRKTGINTQHLLTEVAWLKSFDEETKHQYSEAVYSHLLPFCRELYYSKQISVFEYLRALRKSQPHSFLLFLFQKFFTRLGAFFKRLFGI